MISSREGAISFELSSLQPETRAARWAGDTGIVRVRTEEEVREAERGNIVTALNKTRWKVYGRGGAAELLAIKPGTLAPG